MVTVDYNGTFAKIGDIVVFTHFLTRQKIIGKVVEQMNERLTTPLNVTLEVEGVISRYKRSYITNAEVNGNEAN